MSAQPSGEAVALVHAALRAERALTVYEEDLTRYSLPRHSPVHAAYIRANDFATERLFQRIIALEEAERQLATLRSAYAGADFSDAQYPGRVVLKFSFADDLRVSADFDGTIKQVAA